jgi:hypothetical protein
MAVLYEAAFPRYQPGRHGQRLRDVLFDRGFDAWLMERMNTAWLMGRLEEFIRGLHSGESITAPQWTAEQILQSGQSYLCSLLDLILTDEPAKACGKEYETVVLALDVDGYAVVDGRVVAKDAVAPLLAEQRSYLEGLYSALALAEQQLARKHYQQSEDDYVAGVWGNAISNARHFVELVQRNAARRLGEALPPGLSESDLRSPANVRKYLLHVELLSHAEYELVRQLYSTLSGKGGHPNMSEKDEARLTRHYALITSEFVLLRLANLSAPAALDPVRQRFLSVLDQRRDGLSVS